MRYTTLLLFVSAAVAAPQPAGSMDKFQKSIATTVVERTAAPEPPSKPLTDTAEKRNAQLVVPETTAEEEQALQRMGPFWLGRAAADAVQVAPLASADSPTANDEELEKRANDPLIFPDEDKRKYWRDEMAKDAPHPCGDGSYVWMSDNHPNPYCRAAATNMRQYRGDFMSPEEADKMFIERAEQQQLEAQREKDRLALEFVNAIKENSRKGIDDGYAMTGSGGDHWD